MDPQLQRRTIQAVLIAVGTAITEGPIGVFIRGWSPRTAIVAWSTLIATTFGFSVASMATEGHFISKVYLSAAGLLGLVMAFVGLVRGELRRDREQQSMRLSQLGRRRSKES